MEVTSSQIKDANLAFWITILMAFLGQCVLPFHNLHYQTNVFKG
jgi:hypothetical protein